MNIIQPGVALWEKKISSLSLLVHLYSLPYRSVVEKEIDLAGILEGQTVLNIGCGAVPFTAIYLAELAKARVFALDCDAEAVVKARRVVDKVGLRDRITVIHGDGARDAEIDFEIALVALQARPKKEIFEKLFKDAPSGGRLVFRQVSSRFAGHYDSLAVDERPVAETRQGMKTFDRSVLFVKRAFEQAADSFIYHYGSGSPSEESATPCCMG